MFFRVWILWTFFCSEDNFDWNVFLLEISFFLFDPKQSVWWRHITSSNCNLWRHLRINPRGFWFFHSLSLSRVCMCVCVYVTSLFCNWPDSLIRKEIKLFFAIFFFFCKTFFYFTYFTQWVFPHKQNDFCKKTKSQQLIIQFLNRH